MWINGSRLDDMRHGGDIDPQIESAQVLSLLDRLRIKTLLEQQLNLPADIILKSVRP